MLTLNTALDIIRAAETTRDQLKKIDGEVETPVNALKNKYEKSDYKQSVKIVKQCKYCGTTHNMCHCPACGNKCNKGNMKNHFAKKGHLAKLHEPTDWVSSAVYVKKCNGKLGVCRDPRELNKYMKVPKLRLPTIDDVTSKLGKVQVFTVLDAKDGFLQVKLDEDSSKLTTFHTPFGRYKWLRISFGICSAPEEFQRHVN